MVAQLEERLGRIEEVVSSILIHSTETGARYPTPQPANERVALFLPKIDQIRPLPYHRT